MAYSNLVALNHADWSLFLIVALQRPNIFSFVTELNKNSHSYFLPLAALLATSVNHRTDLLEICRRRDCVQSDQQTLELSQIKTYKLSMKSSLSEV